MTDQTQPEASPKFDLFAQVAADAAANGSAEIVADAAKYLRCHSRGRFCSSSTRKETAPYAQLHPPRPVPPPRRRLR